MQEASSRAYQGENLPDPMSGRMFSPFCVGRVGRKQPTLSAPHEIRREAVIVVGVVVVGSTVVIHITEIADRTGI
ncbi:MAG: hypothetical protein LBU82_04970 [Treponema sp.]|jgi:hypothetical protein|nr:hypothetical protein [Treponema sp.]